MPVVPEMRVIWDAMRPEMQNVMNGVEDARRGRRGTCRPRLDADRGHEEVTP